MNKLAVAVVWNQSHYIPLGGFHPLYRGLFDAAPAGVDINAWDNVALQDRLASSAAVRQWFLSGLATQSSRLGGLDMSGFSAENRLLTQVLPGDVELFHSVPFPSLTRPFLLYFESLRSLFLPWMVSQGSIEEKLPLIRDYYRDLLGGPLCLGVFSHQPDALAGLSDFLGASHLKFRLFKTSIGLPAPLNLIGGQRLQRPSLTNPGFLFVVTPAHEADFFSGGGHRVLRFWKGFLAMGHCGTLSMACERPGSEMLEAAGVDSTFVEQETGRSILWAASSSAEVESLMASSHILLKPADLLCTFDVLRAMSLGCVPVITAVQGNETLVQDNVHGLIVGTEPVAGKPWEIPVRSSHDEDLIIEELLRRVPALLTSPVFAEVQHNARQRIETDFTAEAFSQSFWPRVLQLCDDYKTPATPALTAPSISLTQCLLGAQGKHRAFSSYSCPRLRINSGLYSVWSQGGYFVLLEGCPVMAAQDWSVLVQYSQLQARPIVLANSLPELMGRYLPRPEGVPQPEIPKTVQFLSRVLLRFPRLHSRSSQWLRQYRRLRKVLSASGARSAEITVHHASPVANRQKGDLHLVVDGFHGFNIILYDGYFHAVLQSDGALTAERLDKGRYNRCYSDSNLEVVKQLVIAGLAERGPMMARYRKMWKWKVWK